MTHSAHRLASKQELKRDYVVFMRPAKGFDDIDDETETLLDERGVAGNGIYQREVAVSENLTPTLKIVTVKVFWSDPNPRRLAMQAYIAKK